MSLEDLRMVPRPTADDRGLAGAMERVEAAEAKDASAAEAEAETKEAADERFERATRTLFVDALYRAKTLNGDAAFDLADLADLDTADRMALRLSRRRRVRWGMVS